MRFKIFREGVREAVRRFGDFLETPVATSFEV
jgi:hypothetical protein